MRAILLSGVFVCFWVFGLLVLTAGLVVASPVEDGEWAVTLPEVQVIRHAQRLSRLVSGERVRIAVALKLRNQPILDAVTGVQLASPRPRSLSKVEYMLLHAPTSEQVRSVVDYLGLHDFRHVAVAENRMLVVADGTAGAVKAAFGTDLDFYSRDGAVFYSNASSVMVPKRLSGIIVAVHGLQSRNQSDSAYQVRPLVSSHDVRPLRSIQDMYSATSFLPASLSTVAMIAEGDPSATVRDLAGFAAASGYPVPRTEVIYVNGASADTRRQVEWNLLSQAMLSAAGGQVKQLELYNVPELTDVNLIMALNQLIIAHQANVIVLSFGLCEIDAYLSGYMATASAILQVGAAQGQTFVAAVGHKGKRQCNDDSLGENFPAVSPWVIAVGGSTVTTNDDGLVMSEVAWPDTRGGPSLMLAAPAWQVESGIFSPGSYRGIPDVVFHAAGLEGAAVLHNGRYVSVGGTGLSAALFAGFWARIQSMHLAHQVPLVFPAATLYMGAAANPGWFHAMDDSVQSATVSGWNYRAGFGSLSISKLAINVHEGGMGIFPKTELLFDGVPLDRLSVFKPGAILFRFIVPEHGIAASGVSDAGIVLAPDKMARLTIHLYGGKGNGDVYVQLGAIPTTFFFLAKSAGPSNEENIVINAPLSGFYYVMLKAQEDVSNATLVVNFQAPSFIEKLTNAVAASEINLARSHSALFSIFVPRNQSVLSFRLQNAMPDRDDLAGDGDLYVRFGDIPTTELYDEKSEISGNNEVVTFFRPRAGTYYVMVNAYRPMRRGRLVGEFKQ